MRELTKLQFNAHQDVQQCLAAVAAAGGMFGTRTKTQNAKFNAAMAVTGVLVPASRDADGVLRTRYMINGIEVARIERTDPCGRDAKFYVL